MKYLGFIVLMFGIACMVLLSGFALPTMIALTVLVLAVAMDFLTTWACLQKSGREGNPVMAFMFRKAGWKASFGMMVILWVCFITFRWMGQTEGIQTAVAFAYWLVPANNLLVLARLSRKSHA